MKTTTCQIALVTEPNKPNVNGHIYTEECCKNIVGQLNEKSIEIADYRKGSDSCPNNVIGHTIPGTAVFGGRISVMAEIGDDYPVTDTDCFGGEYDTEQENVYDADGNLVWHYVVIERIQMFDESSLNDNGSTRKS